MSDSPTGWKCDVALLKSYVKFYATYTFSSRHLLFFIAARLLMSVTFFRISSKNSTDVCRIPLVQLAGSLFFKYFCVVSNGRNFKVIKPCKHLMPMTFTIFLFPSKHRYLSFTAQFLTMLTKFLKPLYLSRNVHQFDNKRKIQIGSIN